MQIRAKCVNAACVAYGVEKTILVGQLGGIRTAENDLNIVAIADGL